MYHWNFPRTVFSITNDLLSTSMKLKGSEFNHKKITFIKSYKMRLNMILKIIK